MGVAFTKEELTFEHLDYDARFYVQTAKNNVISLAQVVGEALSNSDEGITRRANRDADEDKGVIDLFYDPVAMVLAVRDDGVGMTADEMLARLKRVGAGAQADSKRGFFHRGIREVFTAMGGGQVQSIALDSAGQPVMSCAVFDPKLGMAMAIADADATPELRSELGLERTGTLVEIPMKRFALDKPKQFEFGAMESQIENCVQVRPVLLDANRSVRLFYGNEPPRRMQYVYEAGEDLVKETTVQIGQLSATLWAKAAGEPIKSSTSRQTRRNGILIRGERAAYEVSSGNKLKTNPAMQLVVGELRIDAIEQLQREADAKADDEEQLIYKADRNGLNAEHPLVEEIYAFLDAKLGPLVADLDTETKKPVSADVRRQLQKLAQLINKVVRSDAFGGIEDDDGTQKDDTEKDVGDGDPPEPPEWKPPVVENGIAFARDRIFLAAGQSRVVKVWFDTEKIPEGTPVERLSQPGEVVRAATVSAATVPSAQYEGVAELRVTIVAGSTEGRDELEISAGGYQAKLPVHVRFPRASGFISQIVCDPRDWESGSALYDPATGRVTVFVGRPEFKEAAARATREKVREPFKHPLYRQLVVESVREAALRPAAERRAEVEWDDLPQEERADRDAYHRLVLSEYYALDYELRSKLLKVFG